MGRVAGFYGSAPVATDGYLRVVQGISQMPTNMTLTLGPGTLTLSWPADYTGWCLQAQTNPITVGLSNHWVTIPNSSTTNSVTFPLDPENGRVFYRMSLQP